MVYLAVRPFTMNIEPRQPVRFILSAEYHYIPVAFFIACASYLAGVAASTAFAPAKPAGFSVIVQ
jgi:hypothetical protein